MSTDKVDKAASYIENQERNQHDVSTSRLHHEIDQLRKTELHGQNLTASQWKQVDTKLHHDGVLPHVDLVGLGNGDVGIRGISVAGKGPNGEASLVTKSHGTTFTYDSQGHVQSWSKHGDTWTYGSKDGLYHESIDGKATNKTTADVVAVNPGGREVVTHPDGSTTTMAAWGGTIDRNAQGQMTRETHGHEVTTFAWNGDTLTSMTDEEKGQHPITFTRAADGKYYANTDTSHQNPLDISVEAGKNSDGTQIRNGVVSITDKSGNTVDYHWGGEHVHWNSEHQLTEIDYTNGNKASGFKYSSASLFSPNNPLGLPTLSGFEMTDKNGQVHSYSYNPKDGTVSIDGGTAVKGTLTNDANGNLTVTETGDGTDAQYKSIRFSTGGSEVVSGKFGDQTLPEQITNWSGKTSTFKYNSHGVLTSVDTPYGFNLHKEGDTWVNASGHTVHLTPSVDASGNFSVLKPDGTYDTWGAGGTMIEGIPDTPNAISKEAQQVQAQETQATQGGSPDSGSNGGNGSFKPPSDAVSYNSSQSDRTSGEMSVDTDGTGTGTGTSYFDGKISAQATNYVAINPGWAQDHGIQPGAIVAVRHDGRTEYAVYADNSAVDNSNTRVHTEGSSHLAQALDPGNNGATSVASVDFYALPNVHIDPNGSVTQAEINQLGEQAFGVAATA